MKSAAQARGVRSAARDGVFRLAIALLTLIAFTSQAIVTQTHLHGAGHLTVAAAGHALHLPSPDKPLPADDQTNCPICQGLAHAGSYVTPSAVTIAVSAVATLLSLVVIDTVWIAQTHSHGWQSRAPPRR